MLRQLMSKWLRADLEPQVVWSEIGTMQTVANISVRIPRLWSRKEKVEQVLCISGDQYCLFKNWASGRLDRVRFGRHLNGREMRIMEFIPATQPVYRLSLCPCDSAAVSFVAARQTWFRLWRNEPPMNLGAGICFIDSVDREYLKALRLKLLDGKVPAELQTEEEMWERMNAMSELDRRAAFAALAVQQLDEVDRQFQETHGDIGPVPDGLRPWFDQVQRRVQQMEGAAAARPVDPETAQLMQRFTRELTERAQSAAKNPDPGAESDRNRSA